MAEAEQDTNWIMKLIESLIHLLSGGKYGKKHNLRMGFGGGTSQPSGQDQGESNTKNKNTPGANNNENTADPTTIKPNTPGTSPAQVEANDRSNKALGTVKFIDGTCKTVGKLSDFLNKNWAGRMVKTTGMILMLHHAMPVYVAVNLASALKLANDERKVRKDAIAELDKRIEKLKDNKPDGYENQITQLNIDKEIFKKKDYILKCGVKVARTAIIASLVGGAFADGGLLSNTAIPYAKELATAVIMAPLVKVCADVGKTWKHKGAKAATKQVGGVIANIVLPSIFAGGISDNVDIDGFKESAKDWGETTAANAKETLSNFADAMREKILDKLPLADPPTAQEIVDHNLNVAQLNNHYNLENIQEDLEIAHINALTQEEVDDAITAAHKARDAAHTKLFEATETHHDETLSIRFNDAEAVSNQAFDELDKATATIINSQGEESIIESLQKHQEVSQDAISKEGLTIEARNKVQLDDAIDKLKEDNPDWSERKINKGIEKLTEFQADQQSEDMEALTQKAEGLTKDAENAAAENYAAEQTLKIRTPELRTSQEIAELDDAGREQYAEKVANSFRKNELLRDNLEDPERLGDLTKLQEKYLGDELKDELEALNVKQELMFNQLKDMVGEEEAAKMVSNANIRSLDTMKANLEARGMIDRTLHPEKYQHIQTNTPTATELEATVNPENKSYIVNDALNAVSNATEQHSDEIATLAAATESTIRSNERNKIKSLAKGLDDIKAGIGKDDQFQKSVDEFTNNKKPKSKKKKIDKGP